MPRTDACGQLRRVNSEEPVIHRARFCQSWLHLFGVLRNARVTVEPEPTGERSRTDRERSIVATSVSDIRPPSGRQASPGSSESGSSPELLITLRIARR